MQNDGTHLTYEFISTHLTSSGQFNGFVADGESAWNPASTKRPIWGPAKVDYIRHPDGSWNATVTDP